MKPSLRRTETITIRTTKTDKALLEYAAALNRTTVSSYILRCATKDMELNMEKIEAFKKLT